MKRRSKLFLIVSAVLIGAGLIVCLIGAGISSAAGDQLFASSTKDGKGYIYEFGSHKIDKIKLDVTDANIQIIGGAETSYIELLNFNENFYSFSKSNALISFKESPDVSSLLQFWESGFTFKGLRYILRLGTYTGEKAINIYLTDEDYVKCFDIRAKTGKVIISDISTDTDYIMQMGSGSVDVKNIITGSSLSVTADDASQSTGVTLQNTSVRLLTLNLAKGEVKTEKLSVYTGDIDIINGSALIDYTPMDPVYSVEVHTKGKLTVNGENYIDNFQFIVEKDPAEDDSNNDQQEKEESAASLTVDGRDLAVTLTLPAKALNAKTNEQ